MSNCTLRSKIVVTRKPHHCIFCWAGIPKGDNANHWVGVYDGDFQANYAHPECQTAWEDDGADEFTPGDYPVPDRIRQHYFGGTSMTPAFPKPFERIKAVIIVRTYPDGREVCNQETKSGRSKYRWRTLEMLERQEGRCCLQYYAPMCPGKLSEEESTFDHEGGRGAGGGKRDDRIVLPDGRWQNGACHARCNGWKGSRFIDYNRSFQK